MTKDECVLLATLINGARINPYEFKDLGIHLGTATISYDEYTSILHLLKNLLILEDELDLPFDPDDIIEELTSVYGELKLPENYVPKTTSSDISTFKKWLYQIEDEDSYKYACLLPFTNLGYNLGDLDRETTLRLADYLEKIGYTGNHQLDEMVERLLEE